MSSKKKTGLFLMTLAAMLGLMLAMAGAVYADSEPEGCIAFTSSKEFTVSLGDTENGNTWDGTVQYSKDGTDWKNYTAGDKITAAGSDDGYSIFFRGEGNHHICNDRGETRFRLNGEEISCSGNIENLLDYTEVQKNEHPGMSEYAFYRLFNMCTSLTAAPELPATKLADYCYSYMFWNCKSLSKAPELPATTLADYCYSDMFVGCESLTIAPELPATTLANRCYYCMFRNCESLTIAPELPATTLAKYCYAYMFSYCKSLSKAPKLPATTLTDQCYAYMFEYCESLTEAPELPATTLAKYCYFNMFSGCKSLSKAPELPAETLAEACYGYMFVDCENLTRAPALPAKNLDTGCYQRMFESCISLTMPPKLPATTLPAYCYREMFLNSGVKLSEDKGFIDGVFYGIPYQIPEKGNGTVGSYSLSGMFSETSGRFTGMPDVNRTYYLSCWSGSGIEKDPFIISTKDDWDVLADLVGEGSNMEGLSFCLGGNIEVDRMVGANGKPFSGSFDGGGLTLTFNADDAPELCAPFVYAEDASFKNLHIAGTIKTEKKFAAGLIGQSDGKATITNCRSSVVIDSSVAGDGTHGGFVAKGGADFEGCVFDGELLGPETTLCGGFLGWANPRGTGSFRNCLFAPQKLILKEALEVFGRNVTNETTMENLYYTENIDRTQGKVGRTVTADEGITVGSADTTVYSVSGITAYDTGLTYGSAFYGGKDDVIPVTIPSVCDEVTANAGTLTGEGASYKLTMPDEDVTLTLNKGVNHAWSAWTKLDENQHQRVCGNDPDHKETGEHAWDDGVVTKEPTTEETGVKTFTCDVCKAERTEVLPKKEEVDPITPSDDTADDTPVDDDIPVVNTAKIHTKGNFTKKQMKLIFPADKSVTNYRIQYRMAGKKSWKSDWSAGTNMYVIGGVKKSSLCEFRIAGFVKLTDGSWIRGNWSKISYRYMSAVPLKTIKADKKKITVTWKKDRKASGYEVRYSLKKNMAGAKTIYVKGGSKTKLTIKGLKSGKKYYVQIRPAKVKSGKKYVGILTNVKIAKVK